MSQRLWVLAFLSSLMVVDSPRWAWAAGEEAATEARMATYDSPSGQTYFAAALSPKLGVRRADARDVAILFDTSASQIGAYRSDALEALRTVLKGLTSSDRVALLAVDLKGVPLTSGLVAPDSGEMQAALKKLEQRAPLGATDMPAGLAAAAGCFSGVARAPRSVIYIGDGSSRANQMTSDEMRTSLAQLVERRVSVSSVAIGPVRDAQLLAAIANHTGGMLYIDTANQTGQQAGQAMLEALSGVVAWPTKAVYSAGMKEVLPTTMPPMRSDREAVLIGLLGDRKTQEIKVTAEVNGKPQEMTFQVAAGKSNPDLAFLPRVIEDTRASGGVMLPTVGLAGLAEVRRVAQTEAQGLTELSKRALAGGDAAGAKKLAEAALAHNPAETQAAVMQAASSKVRGKGEPALLLVNLQKDEKGGAAPPANADGALLANFQANEGQFLNQTLREKQVLTAVAKNEVEVGLTEIRQMMATNPETAKQRAKALLEGVERAPELDAEVRAQLRDQIETALREAVRRQIERESSERTTQEAKAAAIEKSRLIDALARKQEKIKQLMDRFNALMDERRYREAEEQVAAQVRSLDPMGTEGIQAQYYAGLARNYHQVMHLAEMRSRNFADTMYEVEKSAMPFPDEPPLVYPDAKVWQELTNRRKKYAAFDLAKTNSSEQRIFAALGDITTIDFAEAPLTEVVETLKDLHKIPIHLNTAAIAAAGQMPNTPITENLRGITLRSALKLILEPLSLKYVVRDEVLVITSKDDAEAHPVTKVYPVADLVLPIPQSQSANPFQLGGFGQGANAGGLGQGGGGGGFGQGGGFGGQQGGAFAVEEKLSLSGKKPAPASANTPAVTTPAAPASEERPQVLRPVEASPAEAPRATVTARPGQTLDEAWDVFFQSHQKDNDAEKFRTSAAVRGMVRDLMSGKKYDEAAAVIRAALRAGQPQPWMYEALGLALQATQAPLEQVGDELERAMMSAIDIGGSGDETLTVANYMARIGLEKRALKLYREIARQSPSRPEPYVQALATAQKINDLSGLQWACAGVLRQAWSKEQGDIEAYARRIAGATIDALQKGNRADEAKKFAAEIDAARERDCRVEITYGGDAEVDMVIEEPSGSICSYRNPRTTGGGTLLGETFGGKVAAGGKEVYVCPNGFTGEYKVLLRRVFGKVTAGVVTVDIYTHYGTPQQTQIHKQIPLGDKNALLVFDLKNGRRTEPLADAQIANLVQAQADLGRAVAGQKLETAAQGANVAQQFDASIADAQAAGRNARRGAGGAVGFRPVIQTLPEGATLSVQVAVVSADRRYVRISSVPFFSSIGDVSTFNFVSGQVGNGNPVNQGGQQ